jgi:hypothetical protein
MALHNDVFGQQVWDWFCNDLDSCLLVSEKVQAGSSEFRGGTNFPAALTIFSVLEMTAGYHSGKADDQQLTDRVVAFLVKYFSKHDGRFADADFAKKFYNVFRHGLAHQWAPKAGAVSMDFPQRGELLLWVEGEAERYPCLNVPGFFDLTKRALADYESDLDQSQALRDKFKTRYDAMVKSDHTRMRQLRARLEAGEAIQ